MEPDEPLPDLDKVLEAIAQEDFQRPPPLSNPKRSTPMKLKDVAFEKAVTAFEDAYANLMAQVNRLTQEPVESISPAALVEVEQIPDELLAHEHRVQGQAPAGWLHGDLTADALRNQAAQQEALDTEERLKGDAVGRYIKTECDYVRIARNALKGDGCDTIEFYERHNGFMQLAYGERMEETREDRKVQARETETVFPPLAGHLKRGDLNPFFEQREELQFFWFTHPDAGPTLEVDPSIYLVVASPANNYVLAIPDTAQGRAALDAVRVRTILQKPQPQTVLVTDHILKAALTVGLVQEGIDLTTAPVVILDANTNASARYSELSSNFAQECCNILAAPVK